MVFFKKPFQGDELKERNCILCILVFFFVVVIISVVIAIFVKFNSTPDDGERNKKLNILFIVADDLRPALNCYGDNIAKSWNINKLASKSVLFKNAYAQQALCAPSRTSFLTSRRPDTLHLYDNWSNYWRETVGNFTTLPQHFKNHGYQAISIGKVFHNGDASNGTDDYPYSWSELPYHPSTQKYKNEKACRGEDGNLYMNLVCPIDVSDQPEKTLPDLQSTTYAMNFLQNKSRSPAKNEPFFLAIGYHKPHIPFKIEKSYFDLFPSEIMNLAQNPTKPQKMPEVAWNPWSDLRLREDVQTLNVSFPYGPLPVDFQKLSRAAYYASVSYIDDQIGYLLETLEKTGYASNTVIVLIGDHGWSLGEHQEWSKYSNFEVAVKVPLLVHVPGITVDYEEDSGPHFEHISVLNRTNEPSISSGLQTDALVELVDIFPSLCEIANVAVPPLCKTDSQNVRFCSEGISFLPVIKYLTYKEPFKWKKAVFNQYPRPSKEPRLNSDQPALENITIMGYSIRTEDYRYTKWVKFDNKNFKPNWGNIIDDELYDLRKDPLEDQNIADEMPDVVETLSKQLKDGWREALPPGQFDSPFHPKFST